MTSKRPNHKQKLNSSSAHSSLPLRFAMLLSVGGCAAAPSEEELIESINNAANVAGDVEVNLDHRGVGFDLFLDGPFVAGGAPGTVRVVGGVPSTTARVLRGSNGTTCPAVTAPDCIPLSNIVVQLTGSFDAAGEATFGLAIPGSVPAGAILRMVGMGGGSAPFLISDQKQAIIEAPGATDTALLFVDFLGNASVTGLDVDWVGTEDLQFTRAVSGNSLCNWTWDTSDIPGPPSISTCGDPVGFPCDFAFHVSLDNGHETGSGPGYVGCDVFFDTSDPLNADGGDYGYGHIRYYHIPYANPALYPAVYPNPYYTFPQVDFLMYYVGAPYNDWYSFLNTYGYHDAFSGTFDYGFLGTTLYFVPLP